MRFLTRDSSVRLILPTFYRCYKVSTQACTIPALQEQILHTSATQWLHSPWSKIILVDQATNMPLVFYDYQDGLSQDDMKWCVEELDFLKKHKFKLLLGRNALGEDIWQPVDSNARNSISGRNMNNPRVLEQKPDHWKWQYWLPKFWGEQDENCNENHMQLDACAIANSHPKTWAWGRTKSASKHP